MHGGSLFITADSSISFPGTIQYSTYTMPPWYLKNKFIWIGELWKEQCLGVDNLSVCVFSFLDSKFRKVLDVQEVQ